MILNLRIKDYRQFTNDPAIEILVDSLPQLSEFSFEKRKWAYWAEKEGVVQYFSYQSPGNGFGGREFKLLMKNNTFETLIGPWSSRASAMNMMGFPHCNEVSITDNIEVWRRGHTFYGMAMLVSHLRPAIEKFTPEWTLALESVEASGGELNAVQNKVVMHGIQNGQSAEPRYFPTKKGKRRICCKKCSMYYFLDKDSPIHDNPELSVCNECVENLAENLQKS